MRNTQCISAWPGLLAHRVCTHNFVCTSVLSFSLSFSHPLGDGCKLHFEHLANVNATSRQFYRFRTWQPREFETDHCQWSRSWLDTVVVKINPLTMKFHRFRTEARGCFAPSRWFIVLHLATVRFVFPSSPLKEMMSFSLSSNIYSMEYILLHSPVTNETTILSIKRVFFIFADSFWCNSVSFICMVSKV